MMTAVIGMWIFRIFTGYVLGVVLEFGVLGIWIGMYTDWLVRGALYCLRLRGTKWLKHKVA
ncbi:MATE family efflux transporter, partial [Clostridioides difficile]|nr:MATE family efflux transporter [Clostridioides difficile]